MWYSSWERVFVVQIFLKDPVFVIIIIEIFIKKFSAVIKKKFIASDRRMV
jgi:hypothetical protein